MTRARTLGTLVSTGSPYADGSLVVADISDLTASASELNVLDGVEASTAEINALDGVTSPVQPQISGLINVTLNGPAPGVIFVAEPYVFTITNYDILTTYTLSTTNGTVTRSGATITYTPSAVGLGGFVINGRSVSGYSVEVQPVGQQAYTTAGTYSWVAPAGVTSVSIVTVGGGGGGGGYASGSAGGGALGYKNNISVTPGQSYTVVVGAGGVAGGQYANGNPGGNSTFSLGGTGLVGAEGGKIAAITGASPQYANPLYGSSGGRGVSYYSSWSEGGGGAGGYSGDGGTGSGTSPTSGAGGGGGAGYGNSASNNITAGGGGVGLLGQGSSGAAGYASGNTWIGGSGGSGGTNGGPGQAAVTTAITITNTGGNYGGGGGATWHSGGGLIVTGGRTGGVGAVRIIWPGTTRSFPSTNTGDL